MSYQIPSAELTSIAEAGLRGDDFQSAAGNVIDSVWSKFGGSLTINLKNAVAAATNTDLLTKNKINNEDGLRKALGLSWYYLSENFTPGTVRDLQSMDKRTSVENTLRYTLGYRSRNTTIDEGIGYRLRDIQRSISGIRSDYAGDVASSDSVDSAYQKNNATYRRQMENLVDFTEKARAFGARNPDSGLTDERITQMIKNAGMNKSQVESVMSGQVEDMPVSVSLGSVKKEEKLKRYVSIGEKMSPQLLTVMLQRDFEDKKLNRVDVQRIRRTIDARRAFPQ